MISTVGSTIMIIIIILVQLVLNSFSQWVSLPVQLCLLLLFTTYAFKNICLNENVSA